MFYIDLAGWSVETARVGFFPMFVLLSFSLSGVKVMGSAHLKCTQSAKLDLQLIVDSSGSVGKENFNLLVQVLQEAIWPEQILEVTAVRAEPTERYIVFDRFDT